MIEEGLGNPWPDEVHPAAQPFLQGDLIERPPFAYAADLRYPVWGLSRSIAEDTSEDERGVEGVELAPEHSPPYGIITSQTCDLTEEGRAPRQPWFGAFPVYELPDDSPLLTRDYIYNLDPPDLEGDGWVADMRIHLPLEKGLLVDRARIRGFPDEDGYVAFANAMARRVGRPALSSVFNEVIRGTVQEMKRSRPLDRQRKSVRERVHKVKLQIQGGTRLDPTSARLWVITKDEPDDEMKEWFGEWWDRARHVAAEQNLDLLQTRYMSPDSFDVGLYDRLVEIQSPL